MLCLRRISLDAKSRLLFLSRSHSSTNDSMPKSTAISRLIHKKLLQQNGNNSSQAIFVFFRRAYVSYISRRGPYEVLGLERNCSQQEIKDAFYGLSKKYHPDRQTVGSGNKTKMFLEIKEAYVLLRDEDKRREYDAANSPRKSQPRDNASFGDSARNHQKPDIMPPTNAARFYDPTREMELAGRRKLYAVGLFLFFFATVVGSNAYMTRSTAN
ncbi:dnaJ domain-containing protein [Ditylenchus destructor]|nr:dnaJ domain-containing protein [Ditylenchus destructor]